MTYAIFTIRSISSVHAVIVEVNDEKDEFINWYQEYRECEPVIIVQGPISVPENSKKRVKFLTKAQLMEF